MAKNAFYADYIYYESTIHNDSWLLVNDGNIEKITNNKDTLNNFIENNSNKIYTFKNSAIFPGLINTHTHLAMSVLRGFADDLPLMEWLKKYIWPAEKKFVNPEYVYDSTLLSAVESIHSGVTCVNDMYFYGNSAADALKAIGLKGVVGFGVMSSPKDAIKMVQDFKPDNLVKPSLCPHALYTVGPDTIAECVKFAKEYKIPMHTHLAETVSETEQILSKYGTTPAILMDKTGAFDYEGSIFAHCVHLTDDEIKLMGEKHTNVSHCIESNFKLASGFAPIQQLIEAGANITIGTDGAASNNDQSLIGEMSVVSKFHKAFNKNAQVLSAKQILNMATFNSANAVQINNIGTLKHGNAADFFVLSFDSSHMTPLYNPISQLVYSATSEDITNVVINGNFIMKDKQIVTINEETIKQKIRDRAKNIMRIL